jgi:hypothetical protein
VQKENREIRVYKDQRGPKVKQEYLDLEGSTGSQDNLVRQERSDQKAKREPLDHLGSLDRGVQLENLGLKVLKVIKEFGAEWEKLVMWVRMAHQVQLAVQVQLEIWELQVHLV